MHLPNVNVQEILNWANNIELNKFKSQSRNETIHEKSASAVIVKENKSEDLIPW